MRMPESTPPRNIPPIEIEDMTPRMTMGIDGGMITPIVPAAAGGADANPVHNRASSSPESSASPLPPEG